ncbi:peroxiredoxin Q/BCP [Leeuwenhoekiella aequorea]|uniref:thioredoxin-dependent peroxiredoxin n=2 Tax=Leeuwenhoekiella aequorea TaxID=283736 RepID=A0A4V1KQ83_9FLAO|nr:peroxiredoxin Q/BCP [Leeuwenhoekiella aequorea]
MMQLGDKIPDFELENQYAERFNSSSLEGKAAVIYFYPKDFTPGCTAEACEFRDKYEDFKDAGAEVIGVSSDDTDSHAKFSKKHNLPFIMLSDSQGELRKLFDVKSSLLGLLPGRETFVFDKTGKLIMRYNSIKSKNHIIKALKALNHT